MFLKYTLRLLFQGGIHIYTKTYISGLISNLILYRQLEKPGFDISLSDTKPKHFVIRDLTGSTFNAYATKGSNAYEYKTTPRDLNLDIMFLKCTPRLLFQGEIHIYVALSCGPTTKLSV
ncbi:hypothetical protein VTO42DRAFT_3042 [Malbranchea cinnamomea]